MVAWCQGGGAAPGAEAGADQALERAFGGVIALDEVHLAGYPVMPKNGIIRPKAMTKAAAAVSALQEALPQARLVYASATA